MISLSVLFKAKILKYFTFYGYKVWICRDKETNYLKAYWCNHTDVKVNLYSTLTAKGETNLFDCSVDELEDHIMDYIYEIKMAFVN